MQYISIFTSLLSAASALANPGQSPVEKRTVTPDNTCGNIANGNNKGYTCNPSDPYGGPCCSSSGYCGALNVSQFIASRLNFGQEQRAHIVGRAANLHSAPVAMLDLQRR